jgi:flagellum-specific ATP synthase
VRAVMAAYREAEDLINIGAYQEGSNPAVDRARRLVPGIVSFLRQRQDETTPMEQTKEMLSRLTRDDEAI